MVPQIQVWESFVVQVLICSTIPPAFTALREKLRDEHSGSTNGNASAETFWNDL